MAYIARLRTLGSVAPGVAAPLVPARGDKWYIDPEEVRQYDAPFGVNWGGAWATSYGPNREIPVFQNHNSAYPRMPFYQRQMKNPNIKYDYGDGVRKNMGETFHILEEWLLPQGAEWSRDNGCWNTRKGLIDYAIMFGFLYGLIKWLDWMDKKYGLSYMAPKSFPYDNLWVEQGGNKLVPSDKRPYTATKILQMAPEMGLQR